VLSPQERSVIAKAARERDLAERQGCSDELRCALICRSLLHMYWVFASAIGLFRQLRIPQV
jgi:hypothetical protein